MIKTIYTCDVCGKEFSGILPYDESCDREQHRSELRKYEVPYITSDGKLSVKPIDICFACEHAIAGAIDEISKDMSRQANEQKLLASLPLPSETPLGQKVTDNNKTKTTPPNKDWMDEVPF